MTEVPERSAPLPLHDVPDEVGRVALLSDIHGNLPALEACLRDVEADGVDAVCLLGDTVWGPQPREVLERLAALPVPVHGLRGNCERWLLELVDGVAEPERPTDGWMVASCGPAELGAVQAWPGSLRIHVAGLGALRLCHGSPRSDIELLTPGRDPDAVREAAASLEGERGFAHGHTHVQYRRDLGELLVVAPGSVGLPYGVATPGARWALLDGPRVELRTSPYDVELAITACERSGFPATSWGPVLRAPIPLDELEEDATARGFSM